MLCYKIGMFANVLKSNIRLYAEKIKKKTIEIKNKKPYELLNLPYFLGGNIDAYLAYYNV